MKRIFQKRFVFGIHWIFQAYNGGMISIGKKKMFIHKVAIQENERIFQQKQFIAINKYIYYGVSEKIYSPLPTKQKSSE